MRKLKKHTTLAFLQNDLGRYVQKMKAGEWMTVKTYLWIEDREGKASYKFWTTFMHEVCPEVIVESKTNNRELVKAVKGLNDKENRYIIALDNSFDNQQV